MLKFTERREEGVSGDIVILENGVELYPNEWNGEVFVVKENGKERTFKPVQEPAVDDDGEILQWNTVGYEEL